MVGLSGTEPPTDHFSRHKSSTPINLTQIAPMIATTTVVDNLSTFGGTIISHKLYLADDDYSALE